MWTITRWVFGLILALRCKGNSLVSLSATGKSPQRFWCWGNSPPVLSGADKNKRKCITEKRIVLQSTPVVSSLSLVSHPWLSSQTRHDQMHLRWTTGDDPSAPHLWKAGSKLRVKVIDELLFHCLMVRWCHDCIYPSCKRKMHHVFCANSLSVLSMLDIHRPHLSFPCQFRRYNFFITRNISTHRIYGC